MDEDEKIVEHLANSKGLRYSLSMHVLEVEEGQRWHFNNKYYATFQDASEARYLTIATAVIAAVTPLIEDDIKDRAAKVCEDAARRLICGRRRVNQADKNTASVLSDKAKAIRALTPYPPTYSGETR